MSLRMSFDSVGHESLTDDLGMLSSFALAVESPEVSVPAVHSYLHLPLAAILIPRHASMRRSGIRRCPDVLRVRSGRYRPEIRAAAIQAITVDVISYEPVSVHQPEQSPMKSDRLGAAVYALASRGVSPVEMPLPLACPGCINGVNRGGRLKRPVSRDERDGCSAIGVDGDRQGGSLCERACPRTIRPDIDARRLSTHAAPTSETGKMNGHQDYPLVSRPRMFAASRGFCCVNFTTGRRAVGAGVSS